MNHSKLMQWMNQIPFTLFISIEQDISFRNGGNRTGAFRCHCWLWLLNRWILLRKRDIVDTGIHGVQRPGRNECACFEPKLVSSHELRASCQPAALTDFITSASSAAYLVRSFFDFQVHLAYDKFRRIYPMHNFL